MSFSFSVLLIQASCQSKFEEKPPVAQSVKPEAEKSQLQRAQAFHDRIAKAQNLIQSLGTALKKIKTPEITKLTISDLLVQIMDSVKESQVEGPSSQSVSHGEIYLPIPGLTAECRIVRTLSLFS